MAEVTFIRVENTTEEVVAMLRSRQPGQRGAQAASSQWCHILLITGHLIQLLNGD